MSKKDKPKVYGGRNREFAIAMIRHVPKSRNKKKYHRPSAKRENVQ